MLGEIKQISQINGLLLHGPQIEKNGSWQTRNKRPFKDMAAKLTFPLDIP